MNYPEGFKVTKLPPSNRGKAKRGICLHKPDRARTKRAKRQFVGGAPPRLSRSRYG